MALMHMAHRTLTEHFVDLGLLPLDFPTNTTLEATFNLYKQAYPDKFAVLESKHKKFTGDLFPEMCDLIELKIFKRGEYRNEDRLAKHVPGYVKSSKKRPRNQKRSVKIEDRVRTHKVVKEIVETVRNNFNGDYKYITSNEFLKSSNWKRVRMAVLTKHGNRCMCCGASPHDGVKICVDHIKPRVTHPELALDISNLQVLCEDCNCGKGNWNNTDFRLPW